MRITFSKRPLSPAAAQSWLSVPATATLAETPCGNLDCAEVTFASAHFDRARQALLAYCIYPPARLQVCVATADGRVAPGAILLQRAWFGPFGFAMAVRVAEVVDSPDCAALCYVTLAGHLERGVIRFTLTRQGDQATFTVAAWSQAGHWLTRLGRPFARRAQVVATREALALFRAQAEAGD